MCLEMCGLLRCRILQMAIDHEGKLLLIASEPVAIERLAEWWFQYIQASCVCLIQLRLYKKTLQSPVCQDNGPRDTLRQLPSMPAAIDSCHHSHRPHLYKVCCFRTLFSCSLSKPNAEKNRLLSRSANCLTPSAAIDSKPVLHRTCRRIQTY